MKRIFFLLLALLFPGWLSAQRIDSLAPDFSPRTVTPYTLMVNGNGFVNGATILWEGAPLETTFLTSQQLTAIVPCCFSYSVSTIHIVVLLPGGETSNAMIFRNLGTSAPITSYTPTTFNAGVGFNLKVSGNYFNSDCQIYFDNIPQITTFASRALVTANIPGGDVDARRHHSIRVQYPAVTSVLRLTPSSVTFPTTLVGASSSSSVSLANLTSGTITLSSITLVGPSAFGQTNTCTGSLAPFSACSFTPTFTPTAVGTFAGQIQIVDNAPGSPHIISLAGTATGPPPPPTGPVSFSPTSLAFGSLAVGVPSSPQTVTLTNSSGVNITISSVALAGAAASSYGITDHCVAASPLAPSGTCTVDTTFTPLSSGLLLANITFTDTAAGSPQHFPLSGTGVAATHYVDVAWSASSSTGVTGYNIYRGTVSGGPYTLLNYPTVPGLSYVDAAVVSGGHYCYVVTSFASSGYSPTESINSGESCVTVP